MNTHVVGGEMVNACNDRPRTPCASPSSKEIEDIVYRMYVAYDVLVHGDRRPAAPVIFLTRRRVESSTSDFLLRAPLLRAAAGDRIDVNVL